MSVLNAYLTFNGNCAEAMNFYKDIIGGELQVMSVKDSPMKDQVPEAFHNQVMHAYLQKGDLKLMASDAMNGDPVTTGSNVSLALGSDDVNEADQIFNGLSAGGKITMPMGETFFAKRFGMLTDKYGLNWMINVDKPMPL
ncbi:PhnB protein [Chitinophaga dinghuensis]|uniref:PhnB protein n=1 Tax=Chitinophaga dinghuensis TaxID=1539050 RepID=A0A327W677_9BACT|nr:VOC family protein [Chitinophaga dinghuensis]RAJ86007.1 PhnB protein [Chitinophaga dinghuensis]